MVIPNKMRPLGKRLSSPSHIEILDYVIVNATGSPLQYVDITVPHIKEFTARAGFIRPTASGAWGTVFSSPRIPRIFTVTGSRHLINLNNSQLQSPYTIMPTQTELSIKLEIGEDGYYARKINEYPLFSSTLAPAGEGDELLRVGANDSGTGHAECVFFGYESDYCQLLPAYDPIAGRVGIYNTYTQLMEYPNVGELSKP